MRRVALRYGARAGWAYLRPLLGADEESVFGTETIAAIALLDRLLVDVPGAAVGPGGAADLSAADRDRLLAAVYEAELGRRVATTAACAACAAPFDLDFALGELVAQLAPSRPLDARGLVEVDGARARLPTGRDELWASHAEDPRRALFERCVVEGAPDAERLDAALAEAAPLLDLDVDAECPVCGHAGQLRFSIQEYLLGAIAGEGPRRAGEVHRLARAYGWSLSEILSLPRARRRAYVDLAERELGLR